MLNRSTGLLLYKITGLIDGSGSRLTEPQWVCAVDVIGARVVACERAKATWDSLTVVDPVIEADIAFAEIFAALSIDAHQNAVQKGFWQKHKEIPELIALAHGELSEALKADQRNEGMSTKLPDHPAIEEELADVIIYIMDLAGAYGHERIGRAVCQKHIYNKERPAMHGNRRY